MPCVERVKLRLTVRIAAGLILAATASADAQRGDPLCESNHSCPYHRFCALAATDYPPGTHIEVECQWPMANTLIDCPGGVGPAVIARWKPFDPQCASPYTNRRQR